MRRHSLDLQAYRWFAAAELDDACANSVCTAPKKHLDGRSWMSEQAAPVSCYIRTLTRSGFSAGSSPRCVRSSMRS